MQELCSIILKVQFLLKNKSKILSWQNIVLNRISKPYLDYLHENQSETHAIQGFNDVEGKKIALKMASTNTLNFNQSKNGQVSYSLT